MDARARLCVATTSNLSGGEGVAFGVPLGVPSVDGGGVTMDADPIVREDREPFLRSDEDRCGVSLELLGVALSLVIKPCVRQDCLAAMR